MTATMAATEFEILGDYSAAAPLYMQYSGQTSAQGAYVEINGEDRTAHASYSGEIGNAIPMYVWHNIVMRVEAPNTLRGCYVEDYIKAVLAIAEPAAVGFEVEWDGSNHVGRWPNWTEETTQKLDRLYSEWANSESDNLQPWDAGDWLQDCDNSTLGIAADTTDEQIEAKASELVDEAVGENALIDYSDACSYLTQRRQDLREQVEESEGEGD